MGIGRHGAWTRSAFRARLLLAAPAIGTLLLGAGALAYHEVGTAVTRDDAIFIEKIVGAVPFRRSGALEDDLAIVRTVQRSVLGHAPHSISIPYDHPREPRDLFHAKGGPCYDRSRTIEKALRRLGFAVRHVFLLPTGEHGPLRALLTPGLATHAVSEVETSAGWLVVDSNARWISVDREGRPVSMHDLAAAGGDRLDTPPPSPVYTEPVWPIYGLYSRHGRFYPPYGWVPDVNYGEMVQNLVGP